MKRYLSLLVALASGLFAFGQKTFSLQSPDGALRLDVANEATGQLRYSLTYKNKPVLLPGTLGITLKEPNVNLSLFRITANTTSTHDASWQPVWGEWASIRDRHYELRLGLEDLGDQHLRVDVVFRLFNEGLGFRYEFPAQAALQHFVVASENTQFHLAGDHNAFWIPGDFDSNEYPYHRTRLSAVDAWADSTHSEIGVKSIIGKDYVQTPLMLKSDDGLYINIHEAALVNYPAMDLAVNKSNNTLQSVLVPDAVGNAAYLQAPAHTPWRTIIVSDKATEVLASTKMILNLNEPTKLKSTAFIRPQKFVGVWWEMHVGKSSWDYAATQSASTLVAHGHHGANTPNVKRYIDFAAKHGIPGVLVEGWNVGWEDWYGKWKENVFDFVTPYPDFNVKELQAYAKKKGVKLIMHHETSGSVTNYERWMDTAYRFMKQHGYDAVKTGYVGRIIPRGEHHDGQWMVNHYVRVAEKTGRYGIMVDMHEPTRPTGLHRTYPNWLASEAARGNEFNAWSVGNPPAHETILPFTRLMGGPMDYTPGIFEIKMSAYDPKKKEQVHTTLAKQLALYVTMYSPLQMAADLPENYEKHLDAFQFIKDVPTDWDDTRYLAAEPGEYLLVARKAKGRNAWFLGAISNEKPRSVEADLSFLGPGAYIATIYRDADDAHWQNNPKAYKIETMTVTSATKLPLKLAAGGGCAISIVPKSKK
ncbi:glycoside hydrolase family 97 protein [Flaviaesturariibacter flavus]|uniref:Glycoside hydrolase family 97 protein n=1 Tax=Flaviaesturariibacter flavus TaxID=2502780 RepID=A0A4R1BAH8_9BACT|nr:glycoside hydrolase family 97 protein [Flaviaesturariibacter flavus]TCJ13953.1 glycoside hydrolase family 97 protein [Flaviaesturariibacter flavus]